MRITRSSVGANTLPTLKPLCYKANVAESDMGVNGQAPQAKSWRWRCSSWSLATIARELSMGLLRISAHSQPQAIDTTNARRLGTGKNPEIVLLNAMLITSFFYSLVTSGYRIGVVSAAQAPPPRLFAYVAGALDLHRQLLQLASFGMGISHLKRQRYSGSYLFGCTPLGNLLGAYL